MTIKHIALTITLIILFSYPINASFAQNCPTTDKTCLMSEITTLSTQIDKQSWRDKTLRELAKSYAHEGQENQAISLIDNINNADTKALTIRGIGFAAADNKWSDKERYKTLFKNLALEADKIKHKPSHAIAYTYIAMAQAFAGDNMGAMATAKSMQDPALRNKAFGETAEIQAEKGDIKNALHSIQQIDNLSFRNKAHSLIAKIFTKAGDLDNAYASAHKIENAYTKAQALQNIVNYDNAEESIARKHKPK